MTVKDWLKKSVRTYTYSNGTSEIQENRPRLYCNESVELGFPSTEDDNLKAKFSAWMGKQDFHKKTES